MNTALVSCIIPVFNGERYLSEAIDSVLAQTHSHTEVIVADDGSTDGTRQVAARYGKSLRFVTQETAGPAATRNLGRRAARGDFVAFLDADDLWRPEKLARQIARFEARAELDVSVTQVRNFWIEELHEEQERFRDAPRAQPLPGYVTMTMLARRRFFDRVGPFEETLWHTDSIDWFLRAAEHDARIELLEEDLVLHRMHFENLSRRKGLDSRDEFLRIIKRSLDARRKHGREVLPFPHFSGSGE